MAGRGIEDYGGEPHTSDEMMRSKNKVKHYSSAGGAGALNMDYPDTDEHIHRDQKKGESHIHKEKMKPGYRY